MNILVACKIVPDDQDIKVAGNRDLDFSKARPVISTYDKNALEGAAQLAAANEGSTTTVITVGPANADNSKLQKDVLARGVDELVMAAGDETDDMDTFATASALKKLVDSHEAWDIIVCGCGSADNFVGQVDAQLAELLDVPVVNAVASMELLDGKLKCIRHLERDVEEVLVPLPAVVSVLPEIALPRICGMKEILAAGKKPKSVMGAADVGIEAVATLETVEVKAPEVAARKQEIFQFANDGDMNKFAAAVAAAVR